jgi:serine/threonine-protein kinase
MRALGLLFAIGFLVSLSARSLPVRRYEAKITPLGIAQDRDGFLWIATADGIVRFDGQHFEPIHAPAARDIDVTPGGSVWLATEDGLVRYRDGTLTRELAGQSVKALLVTRAGYLLAATAEDLYIALQPDRQPIAWSVQKDISVHGRLQPDPDGKTWFGCGLFLCVWSDADVQQIAAGSLWTAHRQASPENRRGDTGHQWDWADIVGTFDGRIWARNGPDVLEFAGGRAIRRNLPVETFHGIRPGFLLDRRARLWIPGRQLHVVANGELEVFRPTGAPFENVTTMFEDRRGTLWFGLAGRGLAALADESALQSWAEPEGISGSVLDLATDAHGVLTAATNTGGYSFDAAHGRWHPLTDVEHGALRALLADASGATLWIPYPGGLYRGTHEIPLPADLNRRRMRYLYRDARGSVWIASADGLYRMDESSRITRVALPSNATYASDLAVGPDGSLWVGYQGGVALCDGDGCRQVIAPGDGLADPRIRTIAARADEIWVGYRASVGFTRFVRKPGGGWTATQFSPDNGYGPVDTHFLRRDRRGWIWRGSTDGVYVCDGVHTEPEDWLHLTFGDGVNASYANMYAWREKPGGEIWIGTQEGVVRLHPAADWFAPEPPRVSGRPDVEAHVSQPGLAPFQSRIYRYRLLPVDRQWRFSANGVVRYAGLAAGAYRLQVAAGAGRQPVEYAFSVDGAAWPIWPVAAGIVLLFVAVVWALLRWRRFRRKAVAADAYWQEKREFLEQRAGTEAQEKFDDWTGRVLDGRFLLVKQIACGGFAAVYRALDQTDESKPVALKLLHPLRDHEQWRRRRFAEEVTALQRLHNPGIVEIKYAGEAAPDRPYLVMEFIEGITLRALLGAGPIELERAANLLEQIGQVLAAVHRSGVLHRDLKPENIMIRDCGEPHERILLIDFGIASLLEEQQHEHTTRLAGSPGYLAPERWVGLASFRSDLYSLAAIAAEMLSGAPVAELGFYAGDPAAFRRRVLSLRPSLPPAALDLLGAALAYDPEARPADAEAFTRDLSHSLVDASPIRG